MIPEEFVEFSRSYQIGFLVWIARGRPTMRRTEFVVEEDRVRLRLKEEGGGGLPASGERVTLAFANPWYTERCEMGIVSGELRRREGCVEIEPHRIIWALSFDIKTYPERIVKRWSRDAAGGA